MRTTKCLPCVLLLTCGLATAYGGDAAKSVGSQSRQVLAQCSAVEPCGRVAQLAREYLSTCEPVQVLKEPEPSAGICWNINEPRLLPRACTLAGLGHLVSKRQLTRGQEQHAPPRRTSRGPVARGSRLAAAVGQHVGDFTRLELVNVRDLFL